MDFPINWKEARKKHIIQWSRTWCFSVCVKHLNRCKTCTLIYLSAGEWWAFLEPPLNEDTPNFLWYAIWTQIARTWARCSNRLISEPARRFVFSTSYLHCWRHLNFNEDHVWILLMLSLGTDEGDKFGLHFSLLAQLKAVGLELHV